MSRTLRHSPIDRYPLGRCLAALLTSVCLLSLLESSTLAQERVRRPPPAVRRSIPPMPLEAGLAPPLLAPPGTVPPMAIGPAPNRYPSPFLAGPPVLVAPPIAQLPRYPLPAESIPRATNFAPASPSLRVPETRVEVLSPQTAAPANLRVSVSEEFLNRLAARENVEPGPVRDNILGADVTGRQTTVSRLRLDLKPSAEKAQAAFVLTGDVQSLTTGVTPQAMVDIAGQQQFVAVKDVFFDGRQFSTRHATVFVRANNQTLGAVTPFTGTLIGGIANRIAYRAAERRKPESEAVARDRVAEKVYPTFDGEIDKQLGDANQLLEQKVRKRLELAKLLPSSQSVSTTDTRLHYAALISSGTETAAVSPFDGQLATDCGLNVSLHESLLNTLVDRANLKGHQTTDKELKSLAEHLGLPARDDLEGASPPGLTLPGVDIVTDIILDEVEPITFRLERDRLLVKIKALFKPAGQELIPPMEVTIPFHPELEGNKVRIVAGKARVVAQDRVDSSAEPTIAETAVQKAIESSLLTLEFDRALPAQYWPCNGPAPRVTSIKSQDGWLAIAID